MFGTLHAGHVSNEQRLELAGIKMTPSPAPMIIAGSTLVALRTMQFAAVVLYCYLYFIVSQGNVHLSDLPGLVDAENLGI